jgi:hypothetical protein
MILAFGSRRSSGKNAAAFALGGNAAGIDSTGGPPVLAITVKSSFASAVRVGPTSWRPHPTYQDGTLPDG